MEILDTPASMRAWSQTHHRAGRSIALVPTMGALHEGHLALIEEASRRADLVVVSIFVNRLQFDRSDDFDLYPRPVDGDLARCEAAGVDAVYSPTPAAMYPPGFQTHVEPGRLAEPLEGAMRPGHFRGVATVVSKLFGAVRPDTALFGEKDAQQVAVIRRMTLDLDLGIDIVGVATVREPDGLALSSRNLRLSAADRAAARCIPRGLRAAAEAVHAGERSAAEITRRVSDEVTTEARARLDYAHLVEPGTFEPIDRLEDEALIVVAVWLGDVRLIDNCCVRP